MIKFLAQLFRRITILAVVPRPPPGTTPARFVFELALGGIALMRPSSWACVFYIIPFLLLQALRDPGLQQQIKRIIARRAMALPHGGKDLPTVTFL